MIFNIVLSLLVFFSIINLSKNENVAVLEMDPQNILTKPNYLREGNIYVIPTVRLNPKDQNGNYPSEIENYKKKDLKKLFNITHSLNSYFDYMVTLVNKQLIIMFETKFPGEIYISSNYFQNIDKYILKISNGEINIENTKVLRVQEQLLFDNTFRFKIIPKDKYGNLFNYLERTDLDKFVISIKYPDNITKNEEVELLFDQDLKAIIFDKKLTMIGETTFEFKLNNKTIECYNNTVNVNYSELDFNNSNIEYTKEIELGDNITLLLSPRDKYNNIIPSKEIINILQIDCKTNNKTNIEFNSSLNEENNTIIFTNEEIIRQPGNLTLILIYNNNTEEFNVNVIEKTIINNTKFYIKTNISTEEIKNNNSLITVDVKNDFEIIINLRNIFGDELHYKDDSFKIKEVKLYGNDMDMILFDQIRNENTFNLFIPENKTEDFRYLVSGTNYSMQIQFLNDNETIYFYFDVNLTSPENDEGYGNGMYNISHFIVNPNETQINMQAGIIFTFYLEIRTQKDLLYHWELDINNHLNYSLSTEDKSFILNASKINSSLGIFSIELFTTFQSENELSLKFDNEELEKILIIIGSNSLPDSQKSELINYTKEINEDIQPITLSLILRDVYNNVFIDKKDIMYKKQLFVMKGDEKPEQNIELGADNRTFIINFVSDYHQDSFNLSVAFNNSNDLILIKNNIIVKINVQQFLEPEELVIPIQYKPGKLFLYRNVKEIISKINVDDEIKDLKLEATGDFLLYIRDINYEKGEDGNKLILYTGYLAILRLTNKNSTTNEDDFFIYDKKLINIYNNLNNSEENVNETEVESTGFIKIDFYENGNIKNMYYPKKENFVLKSMDYIREIAELIIPKISSKLFTDDIYNKLNDKLKKIEEKQAETDSITNERDLLLRRLSELTPKKKKQTNKIKKYVIRILSENSTEELETEIIPFEKDIDIQLRQLDNNGDNTNNITLLSYEDVNNEKAKLTGSLDKKEVFTNINERGIVSNIYELENTQLVSGVKDEAQDKYIKEKAYNNTLFNEDTFKVENETEIQDEQTMGLNNMDNNNTNIINLLDDFTDENGTFIEYFSSTEYELFNDSVYENYVLENMGADYLINGSNISISITDEHEESTDSLRNLEYEDDYPYYGQEITKNIRDIYSKDIVGLTMKTYVETTYYPHNGKTISETFYVIGSQKSSISKQNTISNSHILARNKNHMTNELLVSLQKIKSDLDFQYFEGILDNTYYPFRDNYDTKINQVYDSICGLPYMFDFIMEPFYKARKEIDGNLYLKQYIVSDYLREKNRFLDGMSFNFLYDQIKEKLFNYIYVDIQEKIRNISLAFSDDFIHPFHRDIIENIYMIEEENIPIINEIYEDMKFHLSSLKNDYNFLLEEINFNNEEIKTNFFQEFNNIYQEKNKLYLLKSKKLIEEVQNLDTSEEMVKNSILYDLDLYFRNSDTDSFLNYVSYQYSSIKNKNFSQEISLNLDRNVETLEILSNDITRKIQNNEYSSQLNEIMRTDLDLIYAKMKSINTLFNSVSNETYNRIRNIKFSFFDDLVDIKDKLSNISNLVFKYIKINSEDLDNNNLERIKENITDLLIDYNMTFSNYVNGIFENYLKKNKPIFQIALGQYENELNYFIQATMTSMIRTHIEQYLEYPTILLDSLDILHKYLNETKEMILYLQNITDSFIQTKLLPNILITIRSYLNDFIQNDFENKLSQINNETSIFFGQNMKEVNQLFYEVSSYCRFMLFDFIDSDEPDFSYLFKNETFVQNFYGDTLISSIDNILSICNINFPLLKNDIINKYVSENNGKYENDSYRFDHRLSEYYLIVITDYINSLENNLKNNLNDYDKKSLLIADKDLYYAEKLYDKKSIEALNENLTNYYQNNSDFIYSLLDQTIQNLLDNYKLNYTGIVEEYKQIVEMTENSFNEYFNKYYNTTKESIDYLIDNYLESLYSSVKLYPYQIYKDGLNKIIAFLENLENNVTSQFSSITSKIEKYISEEERFQDYFKNKIEEKLEKRKNDFLNYVNSTLEFEIVKDKFILKDYVSKKMQEIDNKNRINDINNISNYTHTNFLNTIKTKFEEHFNEIKNKLINEDNKFLEYFSAYQCREKACSQKVTKYRKSKNNNKDCWSIRGLFYSDINEKQIKNDQEYQNYKYQMSLIEEKCKVDGEIDSENCPYDLSDIEPVENISFIELYNKCKKIVDFPKFSIFESPEDLDLKTINSIFNKIRKKINKYASFREIVKNYIYKHNYVNTYKKLLENFNINITEINKYITSENNKFKINYKNLLSESIIQTLDDVYNGYGRYKDGIVSAQQKNNLLIFYNLKNKLYEEYYIDRYKAPFNSYKTCVEKLSFAGKNYKEKLHWLFIDIKNSQVFYLLDITTKMDDYIINYYKGTNKNDEFMIQITNHCLEFINKYLIDEFNLPLLEEYLDNILNDTIFKNNFKDFVSSLDNVFESTYYEISDLLPNEEDDNGGYSPGQEIPEDNGSEGTDNVVKDFETQLTELNNYIDSLPEQPINMSETSIAINKTYYEYLENFTIYKNEWSEKQIQIPDFSECLTYFEKIINYTCNLTKIDNLYGEIFALNYPPLNRSELSKDYFKDINETYTPIFKEIYLDLYKFVGNINEEMTNLIDNKLDDINSALANLVGYTMIDGFNYIETPCKNSECSYTLNISSFKDLIKKKMGEKKERRLEEDDNQELKKLISNVIKSLHNYKGSNPFNYKEKNNTLFDKIRKLSSFSLFSDEEYTSKSGARGETHLNISLSYLESEFNNIINHFYSIILDIESKFGFHYFYWYLDDLKNNIYTLLSNIRVLIDADSYNYLEKTLTKNYNLIYNFLSKSADFLNSVTEQSVNKLKNAYLYFSLVKDNIKNFILTNYKVLNDIISTKTVSYEETEGAPKVDETQIQELLDKDLKKNSQILEKIFAKLISSIEDITESFSSFFSVTESDPILAKNFEAYLEYEVLNDENGDFQTGYISNWDEKDDDDDDDNDNTESQTLGESLEKLQKKMEKNNIKLETDISLDFRNWSAIYFESKTGLHKEWEKEKHWGYQYPFIFPSFPLLQLRVGIQFKIYIKLIVGIDIIIGKNEEGFKFDSRGLIDFTIGAKLDAYAEAGIYGGIAELAGGISGTFLDARVGFRLIISIDELYIDLYIYLKISAFQFRLYVEARVNLLFWKGRVKLVDKMFGMKDPLFELSFYLRYNMFGELEVPETSLKTAF